MKQRVVRAVGDPYQRFNEDGLRMLRMVRFATVLDFDYDRETYEAAIALSHLMKHISKERIQVELNKILLAQHPARGLQDLYNVGMYPYMLPMMCHTVAFEQNGGHHFLDVFEHSLLSVGVIERDLVLRLTMLLHDIGKPFTWVENKEKGYDDFVEHAKVSADIANKVLRDLKYDNATRKDVVELIKHHNDILLPDTVNIRRHLSTLGEKQLRRLIKVKVADLIAHDFPFQRDQFIDLFSQIEQLLDEIIARGDCYQIKDLAVGGDDMKALGLTGRRIGEMLHLALEEVLEHPNRNDHDTLMSWVKGQIGDAL